jgi:hypothetical protein
MGGGTLRAALVAVMVALPGPASALACDPNVMPMPEPQADEVKERPIAAVNDGCMVSVKARVSLIGTHLGQPTFTRSRKWGDIVRMDIGAPNPSRYSRIVCFRLPGTAT